MTGPHTKSSGVKKPGKKQRDEALEDALEEGLEETFPGRHPAGTLQRGRSSETQALKFLRHIRREINLFYFQLVMTSGSRLSRNDSSYFLKPF
jgi:hypothetical protein